MSRIHQLSAAEMVAMFSRRDLSPVEVARETLALQAQTATSLNAFCATDPEGTLEQARQSEARWSAGAPLSNLDGVPVSIKDNLGTEGMPTRFGSLAIRKAAANLPDSPAVKRLREAGTVIIGKTTLPDFAHKIVTDSLLSGTTRNPWNLSRTPGGSSGGASAAIAAGIGPIALGTDGGGSIRIPAAFTGTYGFKPSFGRVPHYPRGAFAMLSHVGPMTQTAEDAASMMNIITRPDARDWHALPYTSADYRAALGESLGGVRIAYSPALGLDTQAHPEITAALARSARIFEALGAVIEDVDPPAVQECLRIHSTLWSAFSARLASSLGEASRLLDPSLKALIEAGQQHDAAAVLDALTRRAEAGRAVNEFFTRYDLVLCPVHPTVAPVLDSQLCLNPPHPVYTPWCNQLGLPAASVFAGNDAEGLPIGVQLVGRQYDDLLVLKASHAFQRAFGRTAPVPAPFNDTASPTTTLNS